MIENPIYFLWNKFFDFQNSEPFVGSKEFELLPSHAKVEVNQDNFQKFCSIGIPTSMLSSAISGIKFLSSLDGLTPHFVAVSVDRDKKFQSGVVDNKVFSDSLEMIKEIKKHRLNIVFNSRLCLNVLFNEHKDEFLYQRINNYTFPILPNRLVLDMFFFYKLHFPYNETHNLTSLGDKFGSKEERLAMNDSERIMQDVRIMKSAYHIIPPIFKMVSTLCNTDLMLIQNVYLSKIRRYAMFKWFLDQNLLPIEFPQHPSIRRIPMPAMKFDRGFHKNVRYFDIKSAYPVTAINMGNKLPFLYVENDFVEIMKRIMEWKKECPATAKWIMNCLIGENLFRGESGSLIRNEQIWQVVVDTLAKKMKGWLSDHDKDVIYTHTDSLLVKEGVEQPQIEGYDFGVKHSMEWCAIFSQTRWIARTEGKIEKIGFRRPFKFKLFDALDKNVESYLLKNDFRVLEDNGGKDDVFGLCLPRLDQIEDKSLFSFCVFKESDEICDRREMALSWDSLKMGFNDVFISGKNGSEYEFTTDPSKINYEVYVGLCFNYLRQMVLYDKRNRDEIRKKYKWKEDKFKNKQNGSLG